MTEIGYDIQPYNRQAETLQDVLNEAAAFGVVITAADYKRIEEIKDTVQVEVLPSDTGRFQHAIETFNRRLPDFLRFLAGIGDTAITVIQTAAIALGLPALLVLVLVVEHSRVKFGIELFETHNWLANLGGWLLVGTNTVLEFLIYHVEYKHGYTPDRAVRGSLRLHIRKLKYWIGYSKDWREQALSPAQRYKSLQRIVTAVILVLATAGSMTEVIARQTGTWYQAIADIATKSSLSQMSTWLGGLLFAVAAVLIAQVVTQYAAIRAREIMTGMSVYNARLTPAQEAEQRAIQFVKSKIAIKTGQAEQRNQTVAQSTNLDGSGHSTLNNPIEPAQEVDHFLAVPTISANGNGHGRY